MGVECFVNRVTAAVLVPDKRDFDGDRVTVEQIEEKQANFMKNYQNIDFMHSMNNVKAKIVESWILREDMIVDTYGEIKVLPKGTWVMTVEVEDNAIKDLIKQGFIRGFSVQGVRKNEFLKAIEDNRSVKSQRTTFDDLGEDFEITHVSLVDDPAVFDATFFAFKNKAEQKPQTWKELFKDIFVIKKGKEEEDMTLEQVKALIEDNNSNLINAIKSIVSNDTVEPTETPLEEVEGVEPTDTPQEGVENDTGTDKPVEEPVESEELTAVKSKLTDLENKLAEKEARILELVSKSNSLENAKTIVVKEKSKPALQLDAIGRLIQ